jgi:hypothetical protein
LCSTMKAPLLHPIRPDSPADRASG